MSIKGKSAYTDGTSVKYFSAGDEIPAGWSKGLPQKSVDRLRSQSRNRLGKKCSEDTRERLSAVAKKRFSDKSNHPMFGKSMSESTKRKLSDSRKGKAPHNRGKKMSDEQKQQRDNKIISVYGSLDNFFGARAQKSSQTKLQRYGDAHYNNSEKSKITISEDCDFYARRWKKSLNTIECRYGDVKTFRRAILEQMSLDRGFKNVDDFARFWRENVVKNASNKNTRLEQRFANYLNLIGVKFVQGYFCKDDSKQISHTFDFALFQNDVLVGLVDCDGLYYHGYLSDVNGASVNNYSDEYRVLLVPEGVKFFVIVEGRNELAQYDAVFEWLRLSFDEYKSRIFEDCRKFGFPYPQFTDSVLQNSYKNLCAADVSGFTVRSRVGEKIIQNFHRSIFHAHKRNKLSPFAGWCDDDVLKKCIDNRLMYVGDDLDRSRLLTGLSASGIAPKVSVFNPYLAKYLTQKYLNEFDEVFDPFSGFSGRLLGVCAANKRYVGSDINATSVTESRKIIDYFGLSANVSVADALKSSGKYESLLTCPPYADKEIWGTECVFKKSVDWVRHCLRSFECRRYVFVVDDCAGFENFVAEQINNKSHLTNSTEYVLVIDKVDR